MRMIINLGDLMLVLFGAVFWGYLSLQVHLLNKTLNNHKEIELEILSLLKKVLEKLDTKP